MGPGLGTHTGALLMCPCNEAAHVQGNTWGISTLIIKASTGAQFAEGCHSYISRHSYLNRHSYLKFFAFLFFRPAPPTPPAQQGKHHLCGAKGTPPAPGNQETPRKYASFVFLFSCTSRNYQY